VDFIKSKEPIPSNGNSLLDIGMILM